VFVRALSRAKIKFGLIMQEIVLIYPTSDGSREIAVEGEKMSFGRGSEADFRFEDDGLSRLHATVYRDGDDVWIVDENSTNGTFVNGEKVASSGKPLKNGDAIKIGHYTTLRVSIAAEQAISRAAIANQADSSKKTAESASSSVNASYFLPLAVIGIAVLVITASAVFIGVTSGSGSESKGNIAERAEEYDTPPVSDNDDVSNQKTPTPTPKNENSNAAREIADNSISDVPENEVPENTNFLSGQKYPDLTDSEKSKYVEVKALKVARMIGNSESKSIPPAAVEKIKAWVDGYAKRINTKSIGGCRFGDNLQVTYERASKNAPFIIRAFNARGIDPQIGLYLAMIESEHCVCLQSPTGPLGMFQFTQATGRLHGLNIKPGASPANPDERCEPEPSARAASSYMKALTLRFGTGPLSVPLAIGSYNSGEGGLSTNLKAALEKNESQERSFWTLIANADSLSKQFQLENVKYVPKFFAAAIIGENPQDFGLKLQKLSTYTE
jgi:FHA domain/Transglycosylase SLT domain